MPQAIRMTAASILFVSLSVATTVNAKDRDILFSARDYTHSGITYSGAGKNIRTLIEPIAFVVDGHLVKPPDDVDGDAFAKSYYANHHEYALYTGGSHGGSVTVLETAYDIQCEGLGASASVTPVNKVVGMRMALASSANFQDLGYVRRAPRAEERASIVNLAMLIYADKHIKPTIAAKAEASNITVFERNTGAVMIASFIAPEKTTEGKVDTVTAHAVFLIAERDEKGIYRATYEWFHSGSENEFETQDLVDILDIDGSGSFEVITQFTYYEAVEYHVYKKDKSEWHDIYQNFGAGC